MRQLPAYSRSASGALVTDSGAPGSASSAAAFAGLLQRTLRPCWASSACTCCAPLPAVTSRDTLPSERSTWAEEEDHALQG